MEQTLVIFSGLPGTGKTTLAYQVAARLNLPILRIDDIVDAIPEHMAAHADPFWEDMIAILLSLVEAQLSIGFSLVVDSVFMGADRRIAEDLAARFRARYRPIYTFVSDETVWEQRVSQRAETYPDENMASWVSIQEQRKDFWPWPAGSALFIDGVNGLEDNLDRITAYILGD